jgi:tetratricopeptide (TPR) repeat protein
MTRLSHLFALVVVLGPTVAWAGDPREEALARFTESDARYKAGEFERAAELLREAYELYPEPILLYNLARALEGLGDVAGAVEHYQRFLASAESIEDRGAIERRVATLEAQLARQDEERRAAEAQRQREAEAPAAQEPARWRALPWLTAGAGVVLVGTGAIFGVRARALRDDAVSEPIQAEALRLEQSARSNATLANVMFGVGGAVAIGGLVWAVLEWRDRGGGDRVTRIRPVPGGIALAWELP